MSFYYISNVIAQNPGQFNLVTENRYVAGILIRRSLFRHVQNSYVLDYNFKRRERVLCLSCLKRLQTLSQN